MFGLWIWAIARASSAKRAVYAGSRAASAVMNFTAQRTSSVRCWASQTVPMVPRPELAHELEAVGEDGSGGGIHGAPNSLSPAVPTVALRAECGKKGEGLRTSTNDGSRRVAFLLARGQVCSLRASESDAPRARSERAAARLRD